MIHAIFGQVAHVGLRGLERVDDAVDRQREAEQDRDVAEHALIIPR